MQETNNAIELKRVEDLLDQAQQNNKYSVMSEYEARIKQLKLLTFIEKKTGQELPMLKFGEFWQDYVKQLGWTGKPKDYRAIADYLMSK
jgi:uncharacterized protein YozE (UPF0346 family)